MKNIVRCAAGLVTYAESPRAHLIRSLVRTFMQDEVGAEEDMKLVCLWYIPPVLIRGCRH